MGPHRFGHDCSDLAAAAATFFCLGSCEKSQEEKIAVESIAQPIRENRWNDIFLTVACEY